MTIYATIQPDGTIGGLRPLPDLDLRHLYVKEDYLGERVLTIADNCTEVKLFIGVGGHHEAAVRGAMRLAAAASDYAAALAEHLDHVANGLPSMKRTETAK